MGHVQKVKGKPRKDGSVKVSWRAVAVTPAGERISKFYDRKGDAEVWLRGVEAPGAGASSTAKTILDVAEAHYKFFDQLVKAGAREAVTRDQYARSIERYLKGDPGFAKTKLANLTTPAIQGFLDELFLRTGSLDIAKRMRRVLVTWCDFAARKGDLSGNPAKACKVETTARPDEDEERVEIPSKEALARLLKAAGEGPDPERDTAIVRLLMFAGPRISELLGCADDKAPTSSDGGMLQVRERLDRHYKTLGKVKSAKGRRDIPFGPAAAHAVRAWRIRRGPARAFVHTDNQAVRSTRPGRLFPSPDGLPVWGYLDFMRQCWDPLMMRAGMLQMLPDAKGKNRPVRDFGPHTLRHVAASLWIAQGLEPKRVQQLLGHSSLQMTMDLYGHLWTDERADRDLAKASERLIG